jgi:hypothetical protein
MVPTLRLCVLYESQNYPQVLPYTTLTDWFHITEVQSVYCAVCPESCKTDRFRLWRVKYLCCSAYQTRMSKISTTCLFQSVQELNASLILWSLQYTLQQGWPTSQSQSTSRSRPFFAASVRSTTLCFTAFFGSAYLCEEASSKLKIIKSKYRSRLTDEHLNTAFTFA